MDQLGKMYGTIVAVAVGGIGAGYEEVKEVEALKLDLVWINNLKWGL